MRKIIVLILCLVWLPNFAMALGLGDLEIHSQLNQRLKATIPLYLDETAVADEVTVRLADKSVFSQAGLPITSDIMNLRFQPVIGTNGLPLIEVTSDSRILEPMLGFIIEVTHNGVLTRREYAAMLDIPG